MTEINSKFNLGNINPDGKGANSQGTLNKPEPPAPPPPPPPPIDPKTVDNFMNAQASLVKGTLSAGSINKPTTLNEKYENILSNTIMNLFTNKDKTKDDINKIFQESLGNDNTPKLLMESLMDSGIKKEKAQELSEKFLKYFQSGDLETTISTKNITQFAESIITDDTGEAAMYATVSDVVAAVVDFVLEVVTAIFLPPYFSFDDTLHELDQLKPNESDTPKGRVYMSDILEGIARGINRYRARHNL